ncbi:hypothetical protein D4R52_01140, partial [bacterium]
MTSSSLGSKLASKAALAGILTGTILAAVFFAINFANAASTRFAPPHSADKLLMDASGTVYLADDGGFWRPFPSSAIFFSHGYKFTDVLLATPSDLAAKKDGWTMSFRDGSLVKDQQTSVVYLVSNGTRRGFTNARVFLGLGYKFFGIIVADSSDINSLPEGDLINTTEMAHPIGTLINDGGTIYLITSEGRQGFTSSSDFFSHGYNFVQTVAANDFDRQLPIVGVVVPAYLKGVLEAADSGLTTNYALTADGVKVNLFISGTAIIRDTYGNSLKFADLKIGQTVTVFGSKNSNYQSAWDVSTVIIEGTVQTTSITVVSPNGGEQWAKGSTQTIRWSTTGSISKVRIYLSPGNVTPINGIDVRTIVSETANTGSYSWLIPNCYAGNECSSNFDVPTGNYGIQIEGINSGAYDKSDAAFSIVAQSTEPTISYITPSFGPASTTISIIGANFITSSMSTSGNTIYFGDLYHQSSAVSADGKTLTLFVRSTYYSSTAGESLVPPGTYPIYVSNSNGTSNKVNFTVTGKNTSSVTVLSPNGGETWTKGTTQKIKWQDSITVTCQTGSAGCVPPTYQTYDIKLVPYYPPCTSKICPAYPYVAPYTIANSVSGSSYSWFVGDVWDKGIGPTDGSYTIQVCKSGSTTCDSSDAAFSIISSVSTLAITTSSPLPSGQVNSSYSASVSATGGTGSYFWRLSSGSLPPGLSLVYAQCIAAPCQVPVTISGVSTTTGTYAFTIEVSSSPLVGYGPTLVASKQFTLTVNPSGTIPTISLSSVPATITLGIGYQFSWQSTNAPAGSSVDVAIYKDDKLLADVVGIATTAGYFWNPTQSAGWQAGSSYYVQASLRSTQGLGTVLASAVSNKFSLVTTFQASVTVLSPNGGEVWHPGETHRISWTPNVVNNVKIYIHDSNVYGSGSTNYITPNGNSVSGLSGYYDWTIPSLNQLPPFNGNGSSNYKIRIDNADTGAVLDSSDAALSIVGTSGSIAVALDSASPASKSVTQGSAGVEFMRFKVTNNTSTDAKVASLSVAQQGTAKPSDISQLYWYDGSILIGSGRFQSVGSGYNFASITSADERSCGSYCPSLFVVPAGSSKIISIKADVSSTATADGTLIFSMVQDFYIFTFDRLPISGSFPIRGNTMTIKSLNQTSVTVNMPNGGEKYAAGATFDTGDWLNYQVSVANATSIGDLSIYVADRNTTDWRSGKYNWSRSGNGFNPAVFNPITDKGSFQINYNFTPGSYYLVANWVGYDGTNVTDFSDAPFAITAPVTKPLIMVVSPNGGETYQAGQTAQVPIKWTVPCGAASLGVDLYKGGNYVSHIYSGLETATCSSGETSALFATYWPIPSTQQSGSDYKIRALGTNGRERIYDESDSYFSISAFTGQITNMSMGGNTYVDLNVSNTWSFYATANTGDSYLIYKINWGDSSDSNLLSSVDQVLAPNGSTQFLSHTYTSGGQKTITFTAISPNNTSVSKTATLTTTVQVPVNPISFIMPYSSESPGAAWNAGGVTTISLNVKANPFTTVTPIVDWADGSVNQQGASAGVDSSGNANLYLPAKSYASAGNYAYKITVIDNQGHMLTKSGMIQVVSKDSSTAVAARLAGDSPNNLTYAAGRIAATLLSMNLSVAGGDLSVYSLSMGFTDNAQQSKIANLRIIDSNGI